MSCMEHMTEELFAQLTEYCNRSDNPEDNARRAETLGFGGRKVLIAPGAIVRVPDKEKVGSDIFISSYDGEFRLPLVLAHASPIFH